VLTRIDLEHFKCFELLKLPLGELTILSGPNASGKSSVLQALALLHQTMRDQEWSTRLLLNGSEVSLGTVVDVVDKVTGRHSFGIGIFDDDRHVHWTFSNEQRRDMSLQVSSIRFDRDEYFDQGALRHLLPLKVYQEWQGLAHRILRLSYLTAERIGPRDVYPLDDPISTQIVGARGEHAASLLHWERGEEVLPALAVDGYAPTLLRQVEARMSEFFPGCSLEVQPVLQANGVTLGLRTSRATDFHRSVHVGFGLTQVFPLVVAALSRREGDLLLIENPEVHLHPAGQAMMGHFLAQVAAAGIQVLIETHSDHVLNGIRRAAKAGTLGPENISIHFFRERDTETDQIISPTIDSSGNIDVWPKGFFDQFDKDMNYFAGWGN